MFFYGPHYCQRALCVDAGAGCCRCGDFVAGRGGFFCWLEGRRVPAPRLGIHYIFKQCSGVVTDKAGLISLGKHSSPPSQPRL